MANHYKPLIQVTPQGLYCESGDFYIDPWAPVDRCVISHAHSDHAQPGSRSYLTSLPGELILRSRLGPDAAVEAIAYGERIKLKDVHVSLHPAGHILGSSQVRIERDGEVWVLSSDYKTQSDRTCEPFELQRCHTFITESTFGLPIFRWRPAQEVIDEINSWWRANASAGKCSVLFGYALGKAQRILAYLDESIGPIYLHGAIERLTQCYREAGIELPRTTYVGEIAKGTKFGGSIVLAPPSAQNSVWMRQFGSVSTAFASGWMRIRGTRRRKSVDRGFVLSDHADWHELNDVIRATGAERILVTHGYSSEMVQWLRESGFDAEALATHFEGELAEMQSSSDTETSTEQTSDTGVESATAATKQGVNHRLANENDAAVHKDPNDGLHEDVKSDVNVDSNNDVHEHANDYLNVDSNDAVQGDASKGLHEDTNEGGV